MSYLNVLPSKQKRRLLLFRGKCKVNVQIVKAFITVLQFFYFFDFPREMKIFVFGMSDPLGVCITLLNLPIHIIRMPAEPYHSTKRVLRHQLGKIF